MAARRFVVIGVVLSGVALGLAAEDQPQPAGEYLGQRLPGIEPEVFAPGAVSRGFHELGITFSPTGNESFYIMSDGRYQHYALVRLERTGGRWNKPEVAGFAADLSVYSASFGPGGDTLFFTGRPPAGSAEPRAEHDIFRVQKKDGTWGRAENLGEPVNSEGSESSVSVAADGTLYFARKDANGSSDIWVARPNGDGFSSPTRIGSPFNSPTSEEARPHVAPDQRYVLFHSNREGSLGSMDLFISHRSADGSWTEPVSLGPRVNSTRSDFGPSVTPDGRYLFFSSYRGLDPTLLSGKSYGELLELYRRPANGYATLYWVDAADLLTHPEE